MFDKTGQARIDIDGKGYFVARMPVLDSIEVSRILSANKIIPFLQMEEMKHAAVIGLSELSKSDFDYIQKSALQKTKDPDGNSITVLSFHDSVDSFWYFLVEVLRLNFSQLSRRLARGEVEMGIAMREMAKRNTIPRPSTGLSGDHA